MDVLIANAKLIALLAFLFAASISVFIYSSRNEKNVKSIRRRRKDTRLSAVRTTDTRALSREEALERDAAYRLVAEGKVVEGALAFEKLGLDRTAIGILENDGFVEEACAMLMRMQRAERAALMYQRNNYFLEAAAHYLHCNQPLQAAECYLMAGKKASKYLRAAAEIFENENKFERAFETYAKQKNFKACVTLCERNGRLEELCSNILSPRDVKRLVMQVDFADLKRVVTKLSANNASANWLALLSNMSDRAEFVALASQTLIENSAALASYWDQLSARCIERFSSVFSTVPKPATEMPNIDDNFFFSVGCALLARGSYTEAARLFSFCNDWNGVALCYAALNRFDDVRKIAMEHFEEAARVELLSKLESAAANPAKNDLLEYLRNHFLSDNNVIDAASFERAAG